MATMEVTVCDVCRNPRLGTTRFQIKEGGEAALIDLCDTDAGPLRELIAVVAAGAAPTRRAAPSPKLAGKVKGGAVVSRRRRTGFENSVTTLEDIEAAKASN